MQATSYLILKDKRKQPTTRSNAHSLYAQSKKKDIIAYCKENVSKCISIKSINSLSKAWNFVSMKGKKSHLIVGLSPFAFETG